MIKTRHYCDWCGKEMENPDMVISYPQPHHTDENGITTVYTVARPGPEELCHDCASLIRKARKEKD